MKEKIKKILSKKISTPIAIVTVLILILVIIVNIFAWLEYRNLISPPAFDYDDTIKNDVIRTR